MARNKTARLTLALLVTALLATGCGSASRPDVLESLATDTIIPMYEDLASATAALSSSADELCDNPSRDTLDDARTQLEMTRMAWSTSEPMWVGPVMDRRSWAVIDWPAAIDEIEELIGDDEPITAERVGKRIGADQRGLGAIEYILGAPGDDQIIPALADSGRCDYLTAVAEVIAAEAALLPRDWDTSLREGPAFLDTFVDPDSGSLDDLINDVVFLLEAMTDLELGVALGEMDRVADIDAIIEGPSELATADLAAHLDGLRRVLVGTDATTGIGPLLSDQINDRLVDALDDADVAVAAIDGGLATAVREQPGVVSEARSAMKTLQVLVNTEVVSHLGVTIGFSDADGDTGG